MTYVSLQKCKYLNTITKKDELPQEREERFPCRPSVSWRFDATRMSKHCRAQFSFNIYGHTGFRRWCHWDQREWRRRGQSGRWWGQMTETSSFFYFFDIKFAAVQPYKCQSFIHRRRTKKRKKMTTSRLGFIKVFPSQFTVGLVKILTYTASHWKPVKNLNSF